jgi:hypothetical protein
MRLTNEFIFFNIICKLPYIPLYIPHLLRFVHFSVSDLVDGIYVRWQ